MPLYRYEAVTRKGKKTTGAIDADGLQDAKLKLVQRQIAAIRIELLSEKEMRVRFKAKECLTLTRELARLLQAGLPLFEALSGLEEKYRGQKLNKLLLDLCDRVRSGQPFSQALAAHKEAFDLLYIAMIANAEKTGRLKEALDEIAVLLSRQIQMRKQLLSALLYPALLTTFCFVVLSSLLFFVVPSLKELFEGRELHPFTKIVFACSEAACNAKGALLFLALAMAGGVAFLVFTKRGKSKANALVSRLPFVKTLLAKIAFVRFCRAAATLLEGGLPAVAAFSQARAVMKHPILERVVASAEEKLSQGEPLHAPFQDHPLIPPLVPRMIAIAQQGGKLPFMMQQISQIYEDELESLLTHFATMAQPILLLVLGGIVGFVLLSVLLPLTDVSSFVT
jgi:general secretion pathway protein F/type IV pilus assembly protein PilC